MIFYYFGFLRESGLIWVCCIWEFSMELGCLSRGYLPFIWAASFRYPYVVFGMRLGH